MSVCVLSVAVMLTSIIVPCSANLPAGNERASVIRVLHVSHGVSYNEVHEILEIAGASALFEVSQVDLLDFNGGQPDDLSQYDVVTFGLRDCYDVGSHIGRISELRLYVEEGGGVVWTHDTLEYPQDYGPEAEEPAGMDYTGPTTLRLMYEVQIVLDHDLIHDPFEIGEVGDLLPIQETHENGGEVTTADVVLKFSKWNGGAKNHYLTAHEWMKGRVIVDEIGNGITYCRGGFRGWPSVLESKIFANALWWAGKGSLPHADAGPDQTVDEGSPVVFDGSESVGPELTERSVQEVLGDRDSVLLRPELWIPLSKGDYRVSILGGGVAFESGGPLQQVVHLMSFDETYTLRAGRQLNLTYHQNDLLFAFIADVDLTDNSGSIRIQIEGPSGSEEHVIDAVSNGLSTNTSSFLSLPRGDYELTALGPGIVCNIPQTCIRHHVQGFSEESHELVTIREGKLTRILNLSGPFHFLFLDTCTIDNSGSENMHALGHLGHEPIAEYMWDFDDKVDTDGDGDPTNDIDATGPTPSHVYGDNGDFTITLNVTDERGLWDIDATNVTVLNVAPVIHQGINARALVSVTLRVAGEKWHNVEIHLREDETEIGYASITRYPGSPNGQTVSLGQFPMNLSKTYSSIAVYTPEDDPINGQIQGATPAWIILKYETGEERIHHTFNVRHENTWTWVIDDFSPYFLGYNITFTATASDPGSDDLTFSWDWGDGSLTEKTYCNSGEGPDPYPSPQVNPISVTDTTKHAYVSVGTHTITLTITDDDGGSTSFALVLAV